MSQVCSYVSARELSLYIYTQRKRVPYYKGATQEPSFPARSLELRLLSGPRISRYKPEISVTLEMHTPSIKDNPEIPNF